jgi:lambda family phage portal protein
MSSAPILKAGGSHVKLNTLDKIVGYISPVQAAKRVRARAFMGGLQDVGYISFGSNRRSMRGAFYSSGSANTDFVPKQADIRSSSRDLAMNSPIAAGIFKRCRSNIVSYGLQLRCRIDRDFLKLTPEAADKWEMDTQRRFRMWASSKNCDASRDQNFYEMQGLVCISQVMSGDVFALLIDKQRNGWPFTLCLRIIESDQVNSKYDDLADPKIIGGIKIDEDGEPVTYYLQKTHPGSLFMTLDWTEIPAYNNLGLPNILHVFDKDRPDLRRGIPLLAPVIETLKQITRLSESELMAAVVTAMFTVFLEQPSAPANPLADGFAASEKITNSDTKPGDANLYEMGSGSIIGLGEGEKAVLADPKRPNALYEPFFEALVRQVGAACEIPAEVIMLQFTSSYSAARAAMLQAWRFFVQRRYTLKWDFCGPTYERWLFEEVAAGRIIAPGFHDSPEIRSAWSGSEWLGPGMGQINPEVETKAALERINGNLSTHSKEVAAIDGDDWYGMIPQRAREEKIITDAGLEPKDASAPPAAAPPEGTKPEIVDPVNEDDPTTPDDSAAPDPKTPKNIPAEEDAND